MDLNQDNSELNKYTHKFFDTDVKGFMKQHNIAITEYTTLGKVINNSRNKARHSLQSNLKHYYQLPISIKVNQLKAKYDTSVANKLKSSNSTLAKYFNEQATKASNLVGKANYEKPDIVRNYKKAQQELSKSSVYDKLPQDKVVKLNHDSKLDMSAITGFHIATPLDIYHEASGVPMKDLNKPNNLTYKDYEKALAQIHDQNDTPSQEYDKIRTLQKNHPEVAEKSTKLETTANLSKFIESDLKTNHDLTDKQKKLAIGNTAKLLVKAKQSNNKYLSPKTDAIELGKQIIRYGKIPKTNLLSFSDMYDMVHNEQDRAINSNFSLYDGNPKYNPMINFRQANSIYKAKYQGIMHAMADWSMGSYVDRGQQQQASRALDIVDSLYKHSGSAIHLRNLEPYDHKIYVRDVKNAQKEVHAETAPIKVPLKEYFHDTEKDPILNNVQAKNYLLRRASVYGKAAYHHVMNSKVTTPEQKQTMKKFKSIQNFDKNIYLDKDPNNMTYYNAQMAPDTYNKKNVNALPQSVRLCLFRGFKNINFARGCMYNKHFRVNQNKLNHLFDKSNQKLAYKLDNYFEKSTQPGTNIEYTPKERAYAKHIMKLTAKMSDNSGQNDEEYDAGSKGIVTKQDTKNWTPKDKKLFNANQKIWKQLYKDGVAPIPEYTPGRVQSNHVLGIQGAVGSGLGKMSYIIKHVSEGDITQDALDKGMKLAKQRGTDLSFLDKKAQKLPKFTLHHDKNVPPLFRPHSTGNKKIKNSVYQPKRDTSKQINLFKHLKRNGHTRN